MYYKDVNIRTASLSDVKKILNIYSFYVKNTAITFEWDIPSIEEFEGRMRNTLERYPYFVAEDSNRILGYAYAGPFVGRKAYDWSAETTIYLDHNIRHQGIGKQLYFCLEDAMKQMNILNLNACIGYPKENDDYLTDNSARFHEHMGYSLVGKFHDSGYKFGRWYDMIWMEKMIGEHADKPSPVIPYKRKPTGAGSCISRTDMELKGYKRFYYDSPSDAWVCSSLMANVEDFGLAAAL